MDEINNVYKIALYNEAFQMESKEMLEEKVVRVRNHNSKFIISAGPLVLKGKPLKQAYVLEIDYEKDAHIHRNQAPFNGPNPVIIYEYMDEATKLANQFCKEKGFRIDEHLNTYPKYQAIVSINDSQKP